MSKKHNIRWGIAIILVIAVTTALYINYDIEHKKAIDTDVPNSLLLDENRKKQVLPQEDSESIVDSQSSESASDESEVSQESDEESSSSSDESSSESSSESEESTSSSEYESVVAEAEDETVVELDSSLAAEDIYNLDLMAENGIEQLDFDAYKNTANVIDATLTEYGVNSSEISLAYYDFHNGEHYYINGDTFFTAASVSKVSLAALYVDLLESGEYSLSSELPYSESLFEAGDGKVTNQPTKAAYTIEELISEAIIRSDNTAMNILKSAYESENGNYREDVLDFIGVDAEDEIFDEYKAANVSSAHLVEQVLIKIAEDNKYQDLTNLMTQTTPTQLFTKYVNGEMMANKFGRYSDSVNDSGIYYENGQPQYCLVVLTDNVENADQFLEVMNLRVNQWFRHKYL